MPRARRWQGSVRAPGDDAHAERGAGRERRRRRALPPARGP